MGAALGGASLMDQHFLFLDTNRVVTVNNANNTYSEADTPRGLPGVNPFVGGIGRGFDRRMIDSALSAFATRRDSGGGGGGAAGGDGGTRIRVGGDGATSTRAGGAGIDRASAVAGLLGRGGGSDVPLTGVDVQLDIVPAAPGDTLEGYVTRHYRITSRYTVMPSTEPVTYTSTVDIWAADLPFRPINPFDQTITTAPAADHLRELQVKQQAARSRVQGTPLKIVAVTPLGAATGSATGGITMTRGGGGGGGGGGGAFAGATTTQTMTLYNIKEGDVDESLFKVPEGFTTAGGRRGGL
jgi:hypothetical protein